MGGPAKVIVLRGDPRHPEPAEHIIEFPGGSIAVTRTTDGEYWAHVAVNRGQVIEESHGRDGARAAVVDARVDYVAEADRPIGTIPEMDQIYHLAVRIAMDRG